MEADTSKTHGAGSFSPSTPASQTLGRGLDVLEQVASGPVALTVIAARLGLSRSTVHRLATSLLERRYLNLAARRGYSLGPKLLELGSIAGEQIGLVRAARPVMESLAAATGDAVLLAVRDEEAAVIVDWVPGSRRIAPAMRAGERQDLLQSAPGRALLLGLDVTSLTLLGNRLSREAVAAFMSSMRAALETGVVIDDGATDPETGTLAAAVRGADGQVRGALAVTSAASYRPQSLGPAAVAALLQAAAALSDELGWRQGSVGGSGMQAGVLTDAARPENEAEWASWTLDAEHELLNSRRTGSHEDGGPGEAGPGAAAQDGRALRSRPAAAQAGLAASRPGKARPGKGLDVSGHGMKGQDA